MGEETVLAADQVEVLVTAHADAGHDLARRHGWPARATLDALRSATDTLVERVSDGGTDADTAVGGWFASILGADPPTPSYDEAPPLLRDLDGRDRDALLLRDAYGLAAPAVATALGTDVEAATMRIASARLAVFSASTGRPPPEVPLHAAERLPTLAALVAEPAGDDHALATRRHAVACPECGDLLAAQARARREVAQLPRERLPDDDRSALLDHAREVAGRSLPASVDLVAFAEVEPQGGGPVHPLLIVTLVLLAAVAGIVVGVWG